MSGQTYPRQAINDPGLSSTEGLAASQIAIGPNGTRYLAGTADPEGVVVGSVGDFYLASGSGTAWIKASGTDTNTGWTQVGASSATIALDFRDWTPTDLNTPGNTVIDPEGVTWQTPTVANNAVDFVPTTGIFATNANGLEATGVANCRMDAATRTAPQIFADLRTISVAYGVDIDPRRPIVVQCFVSSQNGAADQEHAGCAIWRPPNAVTSGPVLFGDPAMYNAGIGFINGSANNGFGAGGTGVGPTKFSRPGIVPPPDVACVAHMTGGEKDPMIGVFDTINDAFPPGRDFRATAAIRDTTDAENDIVMDPWQGFRISFYICAENLNDTFNAVIQRAEIIQL